MKAERFVCDTNVLISAAIAPLGKPRRLLDHIRANGQLLICPAAIGELASRLNRAKFDRYLSQDARRVFLDAIVSITEIVPISGTLRVCRDPDDDKILETATEGRADWLVTGDNDLLTLRPCGQSGAADRLEAVQFLGVGIVRPAEFFSLAVPE